MVDAIYPAQNPTFGTLNVTDLVVANDADINNLSEDMTVTASKTIDGKDVGTLPDSSIQTLFFNTNGTDMPDNSTRYLNIINNERPETTEGKARFFFRRAGTLQNLKVWIDSARGATETLVVTVRLNGADQTLALTIQNAETSGEHTANPVTIAADDYISIKAVTSAGGTPDALQGTLEWVPD